MYKGTNDLGNHLDAKKTLANLIRMHKLVHQQSTIDVCIYKCVCSCRIFELLNSECFFFYFSSKSVIYCMYVYASRQCFFLLSSKSVIYCMYVCMYVRYVCIKTMYVCLYVCMLWTKICV